MRGQRLVKGLLVPSLALCLVGVLPSSSSAATRSSAAAITSAVQSDAAPGESTSGQSPSGAVFARYTSAPEAFEAFLGQMRAGQASAVAETGLFRAGSESGAGREELAHQLYEILLRTGYDNAEDLAEAGPQSDHRASFTIGHPALSPRVRYVELVRTDQLGWHFARSVADWIPIAAQQLEAVPPAEAVLASLPALERLHYHLRTELPESLRAESFVLENWQWIGLGLLLGLCVLLDKLVQVLLGTAARRAAGAESVARLARELGRFVRPGGLFLGALVFAWLLPIIGLDGQVRTAIAFAAELVATFAGLWSAFRLVDLGCGVLEERARQSANRFDDLLVPLLRKTLRILVVVIGLVYLAASWTDDLWSIVAGLSIGSLAIGFAARDSIENLFGTFTVLTDKPFALGDWIVVEDLEGTVETVGFRSTRIRTFYDSVLSVPNRKFISGVVDNYGRRRFRRFKTTLRLTVDTPPDLVDAFCEGVRQVVRRHPYSAERQFHVYLNDLGADSLDVLLYTFVETPDWATELRERHRLLADILRLARELGVRLSVPNQSISLRRSGDGGGEDGELDDPAGRGRELADAIVTSSLGPPGSPPPPPVG
ncbi:mechanosensitive ion channel family protein [Engelhardtia mirabilis]|uniref:mechanosensitive ion channel family protein n=1 Tax=Engelhardtia mirabilis TaxID=2528011 RepID=UPI003AF3BCCC